MMKIEIRDQQGNLKAEQEGQTAVFMAWEGEYSEGDCIEIHVPKADRFYKIRIDDTMDEELLYLTRQTIRYTIPFGEKKQSCNPKAFAGNIHYLSLQIPTQEEINTYRNLARNVFDQHGDTGCFPHASANVETRGESVFAARNAIDGVLANRSHGLWPYTSWGINRQADAEILVEFGRPVDTKELVLVTRADFPHDSWWTMATVSCSDGSTEILEMTQSADPHRFVFVRTAITWIKLNKLIKAQDESTFPALTQIEVYGIETK